MPREIVTLQCIDCKDKNYSTTKNRKTTTERLEFSKFCPQVPEAHDSPRNQVMSRLYPGGIGGGELDGFGECGRRPAARAGQRRSRRRSRESIASRSLFSEV